MALEELQDLKGVWSELSKIWEQIDEMKDKPWLSVAPRKVCNPIITQLTFSSYLPLAFLTNFMKFLFGQPSIMRLGNCCILKLHVILILLTSFRIG